MNDKCDELKGQIKQLLSDSVIVRPTRDNGCLLQVPFRDSDGDPIQVVIYDGGDGVVLSDAGLVAGHLFTLGQHTQDTPAFKLLRSLEKAYGLKLDFDNGRVTTMVTKEQLYDSLMDFTKVILTMVTAIPHIRVEPHRLKPSGQRLKAEIRDQYRQANILDLVEHEYVLRGETVESWPVDFHWWIKRQDRVEHIYVVAVDLDVIESLVKAAKITTLALDAQRNIDDQLRIVLDRHGEDSDASVAASFMKAHSKKLQYKVYDFGQQEERKLFINQSVDEITGEWGESWREFWQKQRALA